MTKIAFFAGLGLAAANPMTLVLNELQKLVTENTENLKEMEVNFAAESTNCKMTLSQTADRIKAGEATIESLGAKVSSHRASQEGAQAQVEKTTKNIAQLETDLKAYQDELKAKRKEFQEASDQLAFTVGQIEKAIEVMQAKSQDVPASLMQLSTSSMLNAQQRRHLVSFIQQAPQATTYEFEGSSGGVIDMLKGLLASFKKQQHEQDAEAINTKHNSNILIQQTTHELEGQNSYLKDKETQAATNGAKAGAAAADKTAAEAALAEDKDLLSETQRSCQKAAAEYKADVIVMTSEIDACKQVQGILSNGGADAYANSGAQADGELRQSAQLTSFLQMATQKIVASDDIADMLRSAAEKLHSKTLSLAATRIAMMQSSKSFSFETINNMIRDMISKLEEEAALESAQHDKCEGAKDRNKANTEQSVRKLESLNADHDSAEAAVSKNAALKQEMTVAIQQISEERNSAEQGGSENSGEILIGCQDDNEPKEFKKVYQSRGKLVRQFHTDKVLHHFGPWRRRNQVPRSAAQTAPPNSLTRTTIPNIFLLKMQDHGRLLAVTSPERAKEHETNTRIIAEAKDAEAALSKARSVVDEFMGQDIGVATRGPSPAMDRIAVLLEKIQENSSVTLVKTKQLEDDAQHDYSEFMAKSEVALEKSKQRKVLAETNEARFANELQKLGAALTEEQNMHKSLLDELAQVTQLCNPSLSPEERQKKRAEEIENLQNALKAIEPRLD
eukprot:gene987-1105_t